MKKCLLLGRKNINVDQVMKAIQLEGINLFSATNLQEAKEVFGDHQIDIVIMGAGIDLAHRLEIINFIFTTSNATTVHMKDWDSGPAGMVPFVNGVLKGLNH